jgi:hypothetical protein
VGFIRLPFHGRAYRTDSETRLARWHSFLIKQAISEILVCPPHAVSVRSEVSDICRTELEPCEVFLRVFPKIGIAITNIYASNTRENIGVRQNVIYFNGVWDMNQS